MGGVDNVVGLGTKGDAEELHPGDLSFILGIFGNFWIFGNAATTAALEVVGRIVSEVLVVVVEGVGCMLWL